MSPPHAGLREKKICTAASPQTCTCTCSDMCVSATCHLTQLMRSMRRHMIVSLDYTVTAHLIIASHHLLLLGYVAIDNRCTQLMILYKIRTIQTLRLTWVHYYYAENYHP